MNLYKYGLRTEKAFLRPPPQVKEFLPQNPNPEKLTYATGLARPLPSEPSAG